MSFNIYDHKDFPIKLCLHPKYSEINNFVTCIPFSFKFLTYT